jgi:hypothetical protein
MLDSPSTSHAGVRRIPEVLASGVRAQGWPRVRNRGFAIRTLFSASTIAVGDRRYRRPSLPPISGYAPHPDQIPWMVVLVIAAVLYLALTFPR